MADDQAEIDPEPDPDAYPDCPVIDAHVHILETSLLEAVLGWFERETDWQMPRVGVDTLVERITARADGFVFFPYAHRPGVAREMNAATAERQTYLAQTVALGTVHAADDDPGTIVEEAFDLGLEGIKLHCPVQGYPPDDPRLDPVYERLVDADLPLVVHASSHPFYRGDEDLQPERMRAVLERFPSLRVCVPHFGLFDTEQFLSLADEYTVYFDTAVSMGERTHEAIGLREGELPRERLRAYSDRIMFGSDYPLRPLPYEVELRGTVETFPDAVEAVCYRNAAEFFGLDVSGLAQ
ncbi:MAG: putative TIM-barrel fold metal-dependent hydrolase [Haloarculaceae archaeon]|jgi:predicted TIM-barrel fold metal-dependent hydrolase